MRFPAKTPVKVVLIGAGGTGAHVAPHLYRLLHALERETRIIIVDGDVIEERNFIRQNFSPAELGMNKARAVAERYSCAFGIACEFVPDYIITEDQLAALVEAKRFLRSRKRVGNRCIPVYQEELVILIGAVDNNRSRQICHKVFMRSKNLVYIDSGNGEFTGQVVCGVRRGGKTVRKPVGRAYPDVLQDKEDKLPTELSCAEASVSAPQSIMANVMAATAVLCMVYNIVTEGEQAVEKAVFSTKTIALQPTLEAAALPKAA